ncbi:MAG: glycoside hydrolase family 43 protein [Burkholderiaceae bacterium]
MNKYDKRLIVLSILAAISFPGHGAATTAERPPGANPALRDRFTADPAPLVVGDTVYLYVGHDEAKDTDMYLMNEWLCYSSKDLRHWTAHGAIMKPTDFKWAVGEAWAAQVVKRNGRFYLYATVQHDDTRPGKAIGVAVADNPLGPFKDARGTALVTDATTPGPYGWNDIDPTVFVDDDGSAWLAWGNPVLYLARLKPDMSELDGPIEKIALPNYTEGPWLSKRKGTYYMTYASMAQQNAWEHLSYATAPSPRGPWTYQGVLTGPTSNSYTIHPGVIDDFKGQSYLVYHNGGLTLPDGQAGAGNRRSVAIDYLYYDADGRMWPVTQSEAGISTRPRPPAGKAPAPADPGRTDARVAVQQFAQTYPEAWPGRPALASVSRPFDDAPDPVGFNRDSGASRLAQTFVPRTDIALGRLSFYAGDGLGTDATHPLTLSLRDTETGTELLGAGQGLAIAYRPQGAGLLSFDFSAHPPVMLQAGRRYVMALQGEKSSLTIFLRASRDDVYADGAASLDDRPLKDKQGRLLDFAFALYAR